MVDLTECKAVDEVITILIKLCNGDKEKIQEIVDLQNNGDVWGLLRKISNLRFSLKQYYDEIEQIADKHVKEIYYGS